MGDDTLVGGDAAACLSSPQRQFFRTIFMHAEHGRVKGQVLEERLFATNMEVKRMKERLRRGEISRSCKSTCFLGDNP